MVPIIFHFVFGMAEDFVGMYFSLPHNIAVKSAAEIKKIIIPGYGLFHPTGVYSVLQLL